MSTRNMAIAAAGLAVALAAQGEVEVIRRDDQPWYEAEDRAVARELVSPRNSSARSLSIAEIRVPPGVTIKPHHHVMEEVYYVLSGEGLMMVEDDTRTIGPGDSVVIEPHQWHNIRNESAADLLMLVTCTPAWAPEELIFERARAGDRSPGSRGR